MTDLNKPQKPRDSTASELTCLLACPCGAVPEALGIEEGSSCKWAFTYGDCCNDWHVEFRTHYKEVNTPECMELAIEAWNQAQRKNAG